MIGKFITIDGIDGSGKNTQISTIYDYLTAKNIKAFKTREPGGTEIGDKIRNLLLDKKLSICPDTECLLMFASRYEHINKIIKPKLSSGMWVISNRFSDATYAYQGGGRGIQMARIDKLLEWVQQGFSADLSFFLDIPIETALTRVTTRGTKDRFESEDIKFFKRVRNVFLDLAKKHPKKVVLIDAKYDIKTTKNLIIKALDKRFNKLFI